MKKKQVKKLILSKGVVSNLESDKAKGGGAPTRPTKNTIELSYCAGFTIPNPCLSCGACA